MSIKMMSRVWDVAPVSGSDLVVLLALADYGDDEGGSIFPSIPSIAKKARLSPDQARRVIHKLIEEDKILEIVAAGGWDGKRNRSNEYRIVLSDPPRADASTPPRADASTVLAPTRADPLLEPSLLITIDPEKNVPSGTPPFVGPPEDVRDEKRKSPKRNRKSGNPTPPIAPPPLREPSEWGEFLEALCWVCHDHKVINNLTDAEKGALTLEAKKIRDKDYTIDDLRLWYKDFWKKDWKSKSSRPSPAYVRSNIAAVKSEAPEGFGRNETNNGTRKEDGTGRNAPGWDPEIQRRVDEHRAKRKAEGSLYWNRH